MAACIKMPLGVEVDLDPVHIVLDGHSPPRGAEPPHPNFLPMSVVAKQLDVLVAKQLDRSRCHFLRR